MAGVLIESARQPQPLEQHKVLFCKDLALFLVADIASVAISEIGSEFDGALQRKSPFPP